MVGPDVEELLPVRDPQFPCTPANGCRACGFDFASLRAFPGVRDEKPGLNLDFGTSPERLSVPKGSRSARRRYGG